MCTTATLLVLLVFRAHVRRAKDYGKDFVRTEVLLAGNVMRPVAGDPAKTEFTTIAHINPGGAADTPLGAQLANKICTYGPVDFIRKLESICGLS